MIEDLTITFTHDGISHTLNVPTEDENLPYNLAAAVAEVINKSDANQYTFIEQLQDYLLDIDIIIKENKIE